MVAALPLYGAHGVPDSPTAEEWTQDANAWAPHCPLCPAILPDVERRLSLASSPSFLARFKGHVRAHVRQRRAQAIAAGGETEADEFVDSLLKAGAPVYRCPSKGCGFLASHAACADLRAHHLQCQATDRLVDYSQHFRDKVLSKAAVVKLREEYALFAAPAVKKRL